MYIQPYVQSSKCARLLYRLTYYCNPEKSRKASFVEIFEQADINNRNNYLYGDYPCIKKYNMLGGLSECETMACNIKLLAYNEFGYRLRKIKLDFKKTSGIEERYWIVGLCSFKLEDDTIPKQILNVKIIN